MSYSRFAYVPIIFLILFAINISSIKSHFAKAKKQIERAEVYGTDTTERRIKYNNQKTAAVILNGSYFMAFFISFGLVFVFQGKPKQGHSTSPQCKGWCLQIYSAIWILCILLSLQSLCLHTIPPIRNDSFYSFIIILFFIKGFFLVPSILSKIGIPESNSGCLLNLFFVFECIIFFLFVWISYSLHTYDGRPWFG